MTIRRRQEIQRDGKEIPSGMLWQGDHDVPEKLTRAEQELAKLLEYERIVGKRQPE